MYDMLHFSWISVLGVSLLVRYSTAVRYHGTGLPVGKTCCFASRAVVRGRVVWCLKVGRSTVVHACSLVVPRRLPTRASYFVGGVQGVQHVVAG